MIAIIAAYGANFASVQYALQRLGVESQLTIDKQVIQAADKIILPGVSNAEYAMQKLREADLLTAIKELKQPFLGICLGMQLLYEHTEEGNVDGLGLIPGTVKKMRAQTDITIPHMGWNSTTLLQANHALFNNINDGDYFYYVHSFAAAISDVSIAKSTHGEPFSAVVANNNYYATQFHPEKSGPVGQQFLKNFVSLP